MAAFGLTVIRHGQTRYNKEKIMQGQGVDEPLSETGFKQANAAGMYLRHVRFTHVFTSDLIRAKQTTASILTNSQYCKEIPVKCDARLRERKYGVAEGRPLSDLKAMAKEAGEPYLSFTPPGGETLDEVKARVKDFFEYLCNLVAQEACLEKQVSPGTEENTETAEGNSATLLQNHHDGPESDSNSEEAASGGLAANILVKYGVAEGRPLSDLKAMAKEAGEPYLSFTPPGGETLDEVKARVKDFFEYFCNLVAQEACLEKQVYPGTEENTETAEGNSATLLQNHHDGPESDSNSEEAASGGLAANILVAFRFSPKKLLRL